MERDTPLISEETLLDFGMTRAEIARLGRPDGMMRRFFDRSREFHDEQGMYKFHRVSRRIRDVIYCHDDRCFHHIGKCRP